MARLLYAIRSLLWICTVRETGANRPFRYYLKLYDRRQAVFQWNREVHKKEGTHADRKHVHP